MSQRGGAVQSHLRVADHEPASDLIPLGAANMIVAVEPLEALRYVQYLREDGVILTSSNAFVNIPDYPPLDDVLERIARFPRHVLLDADRLSKMAGSGRSANIVLLGAASLFLEIEAADLENAVAAMFGAKGPKVVEMNQLAFRLGRNAGQAYRDRLERGDSSAEVRTWMNALTLKQLSDPDLLAPSGSRKKPARIG
jgi:indolepyruvate ferredoxin oxidoreductase beta subunit